MHVDKNSFSTPVGPSRALCADQAKIQVFIRIAEPQPGKQKKGKTGNCGTKQRRLTIGCQQRGRPLGPPGFSPSNGICDLVSSTHAHTRAHTGAWPDVCTFLCEKTPLSLFCRSTPDFANEQRQTKIPTSFSMST